MLNCSSRLNSSKSDQSKRDEAAGSSGVPESMEEIIWAFLNWVGAPVCEGEEG